MSGHGDKGSRIEAWWIGALLALLAACAGALDEEQRLERARQAQAQGDHRAAMIDLKALLQENPRHAEARRLLGEVSLALGDAVGAEEQLRRALELGGPQTLVLPLLADALLRQGEFAAVLEEIEPPEAGEPAERARLLVARGTAHLGLGQNQPAEQSFREAIAIEGEAVPASLGLADVARAQGDLAGAEAHVERALQLAPDSRPAWQAMATLRMLQQRYGEAEQAFRRALGADEQQWLGPAHLPGLSGLVDALLAQQKVDEALVYADKLLAVFPAVPLAHYQRGRVALELGDLEGAEQHLHEVLKVVPDDVRAKVLLGAAHVQQGNLGQAEMLLTSAIAAEPDNADARRLLAQVRLALDNPLEARRLLEEELDATDGQSLGLAGMASLRAGDVPAGIRYLERSVEAAPDNVGLKLQLAGAYLAAGEGKRALALLEALPEDLDLALQREQLRLAAVWQEGRRDETLRGLDELLAQHAEVAQAHVFAGGLYAAIGREDEAGSEFRRALALQQDDPLALAGLAALDRRRGDLAPAIERYAAAVQRQPDSYPLTMALAELQAEAGEAAEATELLRRASGLDPGAVEPHLWLARLALAGNDPEQALRIAADARERFPGDVRVLNALGLVQLARGETQSGIETLREAVSLAPDGIAARFNLAGALLRGEQPEEARRELTWILERQPAHPQASVALAGLEAQAGRNDAAFALLHQARSSHPTHLLPLVAEGDLLVRLGRAGEAAQLYDAALQQGLNGALAVRASQARIAAGRSDAAEPLERWLAVHPDDIAIRIVLAQAHERAGRNAQAVADYERVLQSDPDNVIALNNLAWHYQTAGDARALELAERAHAASPDAPAVADTLGWILIQRGQLERAVPLLRQAYQAAPQLGEVGYHLAVGLARSGEPQEARRILGALLESPAPFQGRSEAQQLLEELSVGGNP